MIMRLCSLMGGARSAEARIPGQRPQEPCHVNPVVYAAPHTLGATASPSQQLCAHVCSDVFTKGVGELPTTQLPLRIGSDFISICQRDICTFFCPVISNVHQFSPNPLLRLTTPTSRHPLGVRAEDTQ